MHTLKVILGGLALLATCLLIGWLLHGTAGAACAALVFLPLWLACTATNMWIGVKRAGYSVREELPVLLVVFLPPALIALLAWWRLSV